MSKLTDSSQPTKTPEGKIDVAAFERELPYLTTSGVRFEIIEKNEGSDLLRIRVTIETGYDLSCYAIAMSNYGFDMGKKQWLEKNLYSSNTAA